MGLVRAMFFHGFRLLGQQQEQATSQGDPAAQLHALTRELRSFARDRPRLAAVMFSRPFADFQPRDGELRAGAAVRAAVLVRVRAAIRAGLERYGLK